MKTLKAIRQKLVQFTANPTVKHTPTSNPPFLRIIMLLAVAILLADSSTAATNIWVSNSGSGDQSGRDTYNTTSINWLNTSTNWGKNLAQVVPGAIIHLVGNISTNIIIKGSGLSNQPTTLLFESNAVMSAPAWIGTGLSAIYVKTSTNIVIDGGANGLIECTANGTPAFFSKSAICNGVYLDGCENCVIKNLTIRNIYQGKTNEVPANFAASGIKIKGSRIMVMNNSLYYMPFAVYFILYNDHDITIFKNTMQRCGMGVFGGIGTDGCSATRLTIQQNRIIDTSDWGYNDGIKLFGRPATRDLFSSIDISCNIIGPKISIPTHPATAWILVDQGWFQDVAIYNNVLLGCFNDDAANGYITLGGSPLVYNLGLCPMNARTYNNTIISQGTNVDIAILLGKSSTGHRLFNNNIVFSGKLVPLYLSDTNTVVDYSDYNNIFSRTSIDSKWTSWAKANGFEIHGVNKQPRFNGDVSTNNIFSPTVKWADFIVADPDFQTGGVDGFGIGIRSIHLRFE